MVIRIVNTVTVTAVIVMNLNGVTLHRFGHVAGDLSIDLRDLPKSVVVIRVERKDNGVDRKFVKRIPLVL